MARQQLLKVLKTLPAGTPVALFVLGQKLELAHGFSSDPAEIAKAAERIRPQVSEMLTTEAQQKEDIAQIMSAAATGASSQGSPAPAGLMTQSYKDTEALRTNTRRCSNRRA